MTTSWISTPDIALSTRSAPVVFATERAVTALSVAFSGRPEERAYRDSAFVPPYTGSTVVGSTYTLVRAGGWPNTPTVFVDELPPPPTIPIGGQPMGAVYTVDFRTLPSQTLTAPGAYTIDDLTWWAKVALTGQPYGATQENLLTNGLGLGLATLAQGSRVGSDGALANRHLFLPFSNVPNYNALAPTLVRWHVTESSGNYNEHQMIVGVCSTTSDAVAVQAAQRQYDHYWLKFNNLGTQSKRGTGVVSGIGFANGVVAGNSERGLYLYMGGYGIEVTTETGNSWAGSFIDNINLLVSPSTPTAYRSPARPNPGVFVALEGQIDATMVYLTHLQIMQPRIA
jgi:hypothetical protein